MASQQFSDAVGKSGMATNSLAEQPGAFAEKIVADVGFS